MFRLRSSMLVDGLHSKILLNHFLVDIVDIKPANMEELTEVITAAEFHPLECNIFAYSSSKGTVRLCDMRTAALCDRHSKCRLMICDFYNEKGMILFIFVMFCLLLTDLLISLL